MPPFATRSCPDHASIMHVSVAALQISVPCCQRLGGVGDVASALFFVELIAQEEISGFRLCHPAGHIRNQCLDQDHDGEYYVFKCDHCHKQSVAHHAAPHRAQLAMLLVVEYRCPFAQPMLVVRGSFVIRGCQILHAREPVFPADAGVAIDVVSLAIARPRPLKPVCACVVRNQGVVRGVLALAACHEQWYDDTIPQGLRRVAQHQHVDEDCDEHEKADDPLPVTNAVSTTVSWPLEAGRDVVSVGAHLDHVDDRTRRHASGKCGRKHRDVPQLQHLRAELVERPRKSGQQGLVFHSLNERTLVGRQRCRSLCRAHCLEEWKRLLSYRHLVLGSLPFGVLLLEPRDHERNGDGNARRDDKVRHKLDLQLIHAIACVDEYVVAQAALRSAGWIDI
eukprot:5040540-Prymnesium_polylepis.2